MGQIEGVNKAVPFCCFHRGDSVKQFDLFIATVVLTIPVVFIVTVAWTTLVATVTSMVGLLNKRIREYGSTLYIGLSRFPHRANTNRFPCNSLASEHFRPKFSTKKLQIILHIPLIDLFLVAIAASEIFVL